VYVAEHFGSRAIDVLAGQSFGELLDLVTRTRLTIKTIEQNRDTILGVKIRHAQSGGRHACARGLPARLLTL
jgi:hypothetical protein